MGLFVVFRIPIRTFVDKFQSEILVYDTFASWFVWSKICYATNKKTFAETSVFQAQPPTPPSAAQEATQSPIESSPFLHSIKRLFLNVNYILLLISYGMNVGVFYAISTLLNRVSMQIKILFVCDVDNL